MPGVADLVILLVLLLGVYIGIARGLIGPLLSEGAFVLAIVLVTHLHTGVDSFLPIAARLLVSAVLVGILAFLLRLAASPVAVVARRIPGIRRLDAPLGGIVHGLAAFLLMYLALGLVLDFDRNVYPLLQAGVVTANELQQYRHAVEQRPWLSGFVDQQALKDQEALAASQPVALDSVARVEGFLNFYLNDVRKPLLQSRFAPIINSIGARIPVIGHPRPYLAGAVAQ